MEIFDGIFGAFWGYSLAADGAALQEARVEWKEAVKSSASIDKVKAVKNKTILAVVKISSSFSYLLSWAHQVRWVFLGRFVPAVGAFALAGRTLFLMAETKENYIKTQSISNRTARISALLEVLSNIFCVISYIATLALFVVNSALLAFISNWCLVASIILLISHYAYVAFLKRQQKMHPPIKQAHA